MIAPHPRPTPPDIGIQLLDELWRRARQSIPAFVLVMAVAWPVVRAPALAHRATLLAYASLFGVAIARWIAAIVVAPGPELLAPGLRYKLMLGGALAERARHRLARSPASTASSIPSRSASG